MFFVKCTVTVISSDSKLKKVARIYNGTLYLNAVYSLIKKIGFNKAIFCCVGS